MTKKKKEAMENRVENTKLTVKLAASYGILIFCILAVGLLSYHVASEAVLDSYQEAAVQSLDMLGEYMEYGFENVTAEAVSYLVDEELISYVSGRLSKGEQLNYYNKQKTSLINKASADAFISNIYFLSDKAPSLSTGKKSMEGTYGVFAETAQGKEAAADNGSYLWYGEIPEIDELMGTEKESYCLRVVKQFYKQEAALVIDIDKQAIVDILAGMDPGEGSSVLFVTKDGRAFLKDGTAEEELYGTDFFKEAGSSEEILSVREEVTYQGEKCLFLYRRLGSTGAAVCVLIPDALLVSQVSGIRYVTIIAVLAACLLALLIAVGISAGINRTIKHMIHNMHLIAKGNMEVRMRLAGKSELAGLAVQMNGMLDSVSGLLSDVKKVSAKISESGERLSGSSLKIKETTFCISEEMRSLEKGMSSQTKDTVSCSRQLEGLAERIEEVSDRSEDIRGITEQTGIFIERSRSAIDTLKEKADETSLVTHGIIRSIEDLRIKSEKIDRIINTVYEIADETALLSLNASIESARAGAHGRGFQVIAEEIRKLSEQSMEATKEIGTIIADISDTTLEVVETAGHAGEIITHQEEAVNSASEAFAGMLGQLEELMEQVTAIIQSAVRMGAGKEEAVKNMESISVVTQDAADSVANVNERTLHQETEVEKLGDLSKEMQGQVTELETALQRFKLR